MKRVALTAALAFMASTAHSESFFSAEAGLGVTHYSTVDGRWYQQGMPGGANDVTRNALVITLGLTGPIVSRGRWGIDWHADYVNLGRAAASCMCTPMDENYDARAHKYVDHFDVPAARFSGSGRSQGAALTIEPYVWAHGLRFGLEAGAYVHHDSWSEDVSNWQIVGSGAPRSFTVSDAYWSVAPVAGLTVGNGHLALNYRHYFMRKNSESRDSKGYPPLWNDADVLSVTYKW